MEDTFQGEFNMFNICEAFFSGFYFYREEFSSSLLGYVLSPFSSHGMRTLPLCLLIKKILAEKIDEEYHKILVEILQTLESEDISHPNQFVNNPLTDEYRFTSALEFQETDLLIKVDNNILLFENKIYQGSIGAIGSQILKYKESLGNNHKIVPIAIFPDGENGCALKNVISIAWRNKSGVSLFDFLKEISNLYLDDNSSLKDFLEFAENGYETSSRPRIAEKKSYREILDKFNPDYRAIISELFPLEYTALGEDLENGGCFLYRLPLINGDVCYPFRLVVNGKCEILYQGMRGRVFLGGKKFDGTHTIRDLIRLFLQKRGIRFTQRYHFSYKEFGKTENRKAFRELISLLERIGKEHWEKDEFNKEYFALSQQKLDYDHFRHMLAEMQNLPTKLFQKRMDECISLYRIMLELQNENKKGQGEI